MSAPVCKSDSSYDEQYTFSGDASIDLEGLKAGAIALSSAWHFKDHPCQSDPCMECLEDAYRTVRAYLDRVGSGQAMPAPSTETAHTLAGSGEPEGGANPSSISPSGGVRLTERQALALARSVRPAVRSQEEADLARSVADQILRELDSRSPVTESKRGEGR